MPVSRSRQRTRSQPGTSSIPRTLPRNEPEDQKSPSASPPLMERKARQVASARLSLTNRTEAAARTLCTPPLCRLREAQVSVPLAAEAHGRKRSLFGTERQPWAALGQRSGNLLFGASSANTN